MSTGDSGRGRRSRHPRPAEGNPHRGRLRGRGGRQRRPGRASRAQAAPTWCCSTSGCPTPTASRCCANGRPSGSDDCPVVMMSGHGTVETAVEATRLGAFDFVEKPLSLAKLLRTVERAHGRRQEAPRRRAAAGSRRCWPRSAAAASIQQLRDELTRVARARHRAAAGRRARQRPRGAGAFHARGRSARQRAVRQPRGQRLPEAAAEAYLFGSIADGKVHAGPAGAGARRHAVHQRHRGPRAARAARCCWA